MSSRLRLPTMVAITVLAGAVASTQSGQSLSTPRIMAAACDGSAILQVGSGRFLSASDETNALALYGIDSPQPLRQWNLDPFLRTERTKRGVPKEADIEAVARVSDTRLYWIGSHGNDKGGGREVSRDRFFATDVTGSGASTELTPVGKPVTTLLDTLLKQASATSKALVAARTLPHQGGGIDIEGMTATSRGTLFIGFRSPLVNQKAIIVELLNPEQAALRGEVPRFAEPRLVDFGGLGVRDMAPTAVHDEFFVVAGSAGAVGTQVLYTWKSDQSAGSRVASGLPTPANFEAVAIDTESTHLLLASDDGELGTPACKDRKVSERSFRVWSQVLR